MGTRELISAIHAALRGRTYETTDLAQDVLGALAEPRTPARQLTPR
jgi:DNA-binding NarL/FixJ family response regulator